MATKHKRVRVVARVLVYRDGHIKDNLCCDMTVNGKLHYFYPAPKCFDDLVTGSQNLAEIEVTINEDDGRNPRNAKLVRYLK